MQGMTSSIVTNFFKENPSVLNFKVYYISCSEKVEVFYDPDLNPSRHAPPYVRYVAEHTFWPCFSSILAFGLYIGQPFSIGYDMLGHIAIISMTFVTWVVFKQSIRIYMDPEKEKEDWLRMPDRHSSRCDEMTAEQRIARAQEFELAKLGE